MALVPAAKAATAAAAALAGAAWINSRYAISSDLAQIKGMRQARDFYLTTLRERGNDDWSFYHVLHSTYGTNEQKQAFIFEERSWTYGELRGEIGRLAEAFAALGIKNRTVVGVYINNSPEFLFAWFALYKLGAIPAPVNTAITKEPFRHCLKISEAEYFICTYELWDAATSSLELGDGGQNELHSLLPRMKAVILYDYGTYSETVATTPASIADIVLVHSQLSPFMPQMADFPKESRPKVAQDDTSCYLFTSGTTGFPKASTWPAAYSSISFAPHKWPYMYEVPRRMYICMPMFHGSAAFACLPSTFATSGTVILARRFSVSRFWHDCRRSNADSFLYIGEMVRYLVQAPPDPHFPDPKTMHNIKVCYGLGLSPPTWRALRERFGVPWIIEYYSASEAPVAICNSNKANDEGVGHIAHWGPLMRKSWFGQDSLYIIRTDPETGEPKRNKKGLCEQVGYDEKGEVIARVDPPLRRSHDYVGEGGAEATEKKMIKDVFKHGDVFVRLGDAFTINRRGYIKFHDRLGDTYRAKGHNISTTEVESAFSKHPNIVSANVYAIPMNTYGYEGQLGCAAVNLRSGASPDSVPGHEIETVSDLEDWLVSSAGLPAYGVPRFLRVIVDVDEEGPARDEGSRRKDIPGGERVSIIMKKLKTGLRREGFSMPRDCKDRMYFIEREGRGFRLLDEDLKQLLLGGRARI